MPSRFTPKRSSNSTTLTTPRRWVPSPILRSPSHASTSNTTLLRSISTTRAMAWTVRPTGVAAKVTDFHVHADARKAGKMGSNGGACRHFHMQDHDRRGVDLRHFPATK